MRDQQNQTIAFSIIKSIPGRNAPPEEESTGVLLDTSEVGLGFLTGASLRPGDLLRFKSPELARQGIVMWTLQEEHRIRVGVRFLH